VKTILERYHKIVIPAQHWLSPTNKILQEYCALVVYMFQEARTFATTKTNLESLLDLDIMLILYIV
jgi:hypothetical protein